MYSHEIKQHLQEILQKLAKKDKALYFRVVNKINEIIQEKEVEHYKNLRYPLQDKKRVQIGHFVLVFRFNKQENKIYFLDFEHHDNAYK